MVTYLQQTVFLNKDMFLSGSAIERFENLPFSHMIIQTQGAPRKRIDSNYFVIQLKEVKCTHTILVLAVIKIHPINS